MLNLLLFILISYGFTLIAVDGKILDPIRPKWKLFHCYQCLGFWISMVVFLLFWFMGDIRLFKNIYIGAFLFGCLGSGTSTFLCSIFDDYGLKVLHHNNDKSK